MSRERAVGTKAETATVRYLRANGFPHAERAALSGRDDTGDVTGTPGLAWEVRNRRQVRLVSWLRDAVARKRVRHADYGALVHKPDGMGEGSVADWPATLPLGDLVLLYRQAGYGVLLEEEK